MAVRKVKLAIPEILNKIAGFYKCCKLKDKGDGKKA